MHGEQHYQHEQIAVGQEKEQLNFSVIPFVCHNQREKMGKKKLERKK